MVVDVDQIIVIKKYQVGASCSKIAKELGTTHTTIRNILKKNHIARRTYKEAAIGLRCKVDPKEVIQQYQNGVSTGQIAKKYGVSTNTIFNILTDNHINGRTYKEAAIKRDQYSLHSGVNQGIITEKEYLDILARKWGYKSHNDYANNRKYKKGICRPLEEATESGAYLGVHIAERILSKIFENVQRMPYNNIGYDFICKKGYKIDVKCGCLTQENNGHVWYFRIEKNTIADYFLILAFDSRKHLEPKHIWLINSNESLRDMRQKKPIKTRPLKQITELRIPNTSKHLTIFEPFEMTDKLEQLKECCNTLRE